MAASDPNQLRRYRKARTFTQAEMARLIGVSQQTYARYEAGLNPTPPPIQAQLAAMLGAGDHVLFPDTITTLPSEGQAK